MPRLNVQLLIIDPQIDFMDSPGSTLPVSGANEDMKRLAAMIGRLKGKIDDIHVTLDSHRVLDIAHPGLYLSQSGQHPAPFTIITDKDIEDGIWTPVNENLRVPDLDNRSIKEYLLYYTKVLKAAGNKFSLMIWPEHCRIGSPGHGIQPDLLAALWDWEVTRFASTNFVTKGSNPWTEHYGGLLAEVPLPSDPSTGLNTQLLTVLQEADLVAVGGEASSHCVRNTVQQVIDNIGGDHAKKFVLLTDCMSPVAAVTDGSGNVIVDFPKLTEDWMRQIAQKHHVQLTTSTDFLA